MKHIKPKIETKWKPTPLIYKFDKPKGHFQSAYWIYVFVPAGFILGILIYLVAR